MILYVRQEPADTPDETEPEVPEQAAEAVEETYVPQEQEETAPVIELPPLRKLFPLLVFAGMLLVILFAGIYRMYADKRKKGNKTV